MVKREIKKAMGRTALGAIFVLFFLLVSPMSVLGDNTNQQISLGSPVNGSLSGTGAKDYYYFTIGEGYTSLTVQTYNTEDGYDFDLYVKYGDYPTTSDYDGRGYTSSSDETVSFSNPPAGTYYVMVHSYSGSGTYSLVATADGGTEVTALTSGEAASGSLSDTGDKDYYSIDVGTASSLTVVTDGPSGADFDLYVKYGALPTTSDYDGRGYTSSSDEQVTINNPQAGTYYIMVRSYSGSGSYTITATVSGSDTTPPAISDITVTSITSDSATITWVTDEPSSSVVEYGTTTSYGSTATGSDGVTSHSVTISGLSAGTTYHFRVRSTDAAGNTAVSGDHTFTTSSAVDTEAPTISSVSASSITEDSVTITWVTDEPSSSVVEYGTTTSYGSTATGSDGVTSHSVTISGLSPGTTYHYRVRSTDAAGNTATSGDHTFTTTGGSTVIELTLGSWSSGDSLSSTGDKAYYKVYLDDSYDSLVVNLDGPSSGADFDLYVKYGDLPTTSDYDGRGYTSSADEQVTINDPSTGWYYIMVHSYSGSGTFYVKADVTGGSQEDTTPPAISSISVSSITEDSATITWVTDEPSSSVVEYGTTTSYGSTATGSDGVTSHSVTISGLSPGTTYHYRVRSTDAAGNTATSGDHTFTTTGSSGPTELTLDGSGISSSLSGTGAKEYYYVTVPSGKASLTVETYNTGSGYDFDLYVKYGDLPTTSDYDGRGYTESASETVTINNPQAGTYYIMVHSYSGSGTYSIRAKSTDQSSSSNKIALCIGISDYRYINDLSYADDDAYDWADYLQSKGYSVTLLIDSQASEAAIYDAIDNLVSSAGPDTWVAITFSGHGGFQSEGGYSSSAGTTYGGQVDGHPSLYFAWDADGNGHGCILDNVLAYHLENLQSTHVFIFFDSCRSGGMDEVAGSSDSGRYVSETCGWDEYGYDAPQYNNGAWTHWFLEWGLIQQGFSNCETTYYYAAPKYNSEHSDSHPEEEDHYSGYFSL